MATESTPLLRSSPSCRKPYSVFTPAQKRLIILTAALASSFSPFSANIYYPALNALAADLHVTDSQINLTITTYMIFQSLSPTLMGTFADTSGRRPAYIVCFTIYIVGNIALALQHSYPALLILRAVQSCGSSGTVALASAVAADIITSDERGLYMGFTSLGNILAPSLGPILGGVLSEYLGWRSIFWCLAIAASIFLMPLCVFFPETGRAVVGDGSIEATGWNRSVWGWWIARGSSSTSSGGAAAAAASIGDTVTDVTTRKNKKKKRFPDPLASLRILFHLPTGLILLSNGMVFASYYAVTAGIPSQFKSLYGLSDLGIGFMFIPAGLGSLLSATFNGAIVDWNYRRVLRTTHAQTISERRRRRRRRRGDENESGNDDEGREFPIERARLQIGGPMTLLSSLTILTYGLTLSSHPPLPISLTLIFLVSFFITASYNVMNVLLVDLYYATPATAMATNNLVRCLLGATATALVQPAIVRWGNGVTYGVVAGLVAGVCPVLEVVYYRGMGWRVRRERKERDKSRG